VNVRGRQMLQEEGAPKAANMPLVAHLLMTLAYLGTGKLALLIAVPPGYASPIFPPA